MSESSQSRISVCARERCALVQEVSEDVHCIAIQWDLSMPICAYAPLLYASLLLMYYKSYLFYIRGYTYTSNLCIHICIYVCMYVCIYVCMFMCACICICMYVRMYMFKCMYAYVCMLIFI